MTRLTTANQIEKALGNALQIINHSEIHSVKSAALWPAQFAQTGLVVYRETGDVSALRQARTETATVLDLAENGEQAEVIQGPIRAKAAREAFERENRPTFEAAISQLAVDDKSRFDHYRYKFDNSSGKQRKRAKQQLYHFLESRKIATPWMV